ncbi:MAG: hypothetical protein LBQ54_13745 [Planctomycetaceae bacterium]|nr:hypothetical protein [Planctomycetaceae bacterium]
MKKTALFWVLFCTFLTISSRNVEGQNIPAGWKKEGLTQESFYRDFQMPPVGYGDVAFYWWLGDPLTKERLSWQLERLAKMGYGMTGLQINYAHTDKGGLSYGLSMPSEPLLFSQEWWELVQWYMQETKKRGIAVSLSDYTLGIGQGWKWDEAIHAYPEIIGNILDCRIVDANEPTLRDENVISDEVINGKKYIITARKVEPSIDPMHPKSGVAVVEKFLQPFEDHNPGEGGKGLNFFFSDELVFRVSGKLWNDYFAKEFLKRKGYDVRTELAALFTDIGQHTVKVRLDYYDVLVALSEENYFRPIYNWHQERGMTYGCDHGGRGRDLTEFGDYFRTQRWNQGPGSDQPGLGRDVVKAKVAASIAHLNQRPRVWLEGFYGSGWGTSSEQIADATFANFLMGYNLLSLHGLYYSTHGGWWEWAPPCNHWRMPYWEHFKTFMDAEQRLAYLLTQGSHVCDVAVWYPVAPVQAEIDAGQSHSLSFSMCEVLYRNGIDMDFIDFQSIDEAMIKDGRLNIAGESYRVLVLPHPRAIRHSTLEKAVAFAKAGGIVITLGALPEFSDRKGANDPEVQKLAAQLPEKMRFQNVEDALAAIRSTFVQDIEVKDKKSSFYFVHRKVAESDIYVFYLLPTNAECTVRCSGKVELWDVWTGKTTPLPVLEQNENSTRFRLNNTSGELVLVVFTPGKAAVDTNGSPMVVQRKELPLEGMWETEIIPTMDNTFGDFRWPPQPGEIIGAESRQFQFTLISANADSSENENKVISDWRQQTYSFGPKFRQIGPLPGDMEEKVLQNLESELSEICEYPLKPLAVGEKLYVWKDYDFSWRYGVEGDPGHQGYHGLKENMYDEFIRLGQYTTSGHLQTVRLPEAEGTRYYLWTTVLVPNETKGVILSGGMKPSAVWVNGQKWDTGADSVMLHPEANPVLLRYDQPGTGYFVIASLDSPFAKEVHPGSWEHPTLHDSSVWIWNAPGKGNGNATFRRSFVLSKEQIPRKAVLCMTADDDFTLWVNGKLLGKGVMWNEVQSFDVTNSLREGKNLIAVQAVNGGGPHGFVGELRVKNATDKNAVLLATDKNWLCSDSSGSHWIQPDFDDSQWQPATELSPFAGSLWATHPTMGPPKLQGTALNGTKHETTGSLAMRWFDAKSNRLQRGIFPFDLFAGKTVLCGYRFQTAPGTQQIVVPRKGAKAFVKENDRITALPVAGIQPGLWGEKTIFSLPAKMAKSATEVNITLSVNGGEYGGSVFDIPISFRCGKGEMSVGDWSNIEGLRTYSGGIRYSKCFSITADDIRNSSKIMLNLGRVVSSAKVFVNGEPVGTKVTAPWTFDIKPFLHAGENSIEAEVYNTLGNHYLTIPTRYQGGIESGLIGPVQIDMY